MNGDKDKTIKRKLYETLREFHKDKDFVVEVGSIVTHEEDMQILIDFIDQNKEATTEEVLVLSVELNQRRYPERYVNAKEE